MNIMNLIQAYIIFNSISKYGSVSDMAFYGTAFRIFTFCLTPIFGLMRALQPVIGIDFGAGNNRRVIKSFNTFFISASILTLPMWLISMVKPDFLLALVIKNVVFDSTSLNYFRLYMLNLPFLSYLFMAMTFFPAIEKGKPAALIGIVRQVFFYIPVMIILAKFIGISGIYIGSFLIDLSITIITVILVQKEFKNLKLKANVS